MEASLGSVFWVMLILTNCVMPETIDCRYEASICQCTEPNNCWLQCDDPDTACRNKELHCMNDQSCEITCGGGGEGSCRNAIIYAHGAQTLVVDCDEVQTCQNVIINAQNVTGSIDVICGTDTENYACDYVTIIADVSSSVTVDCNLNSACRGATVNCGVDVVECNLNCYQGSSADVCQGVTLICGSGSCELLCEDNGNNCGDITVNFTNNPESFTCNGAMCPIGLSATPTSLPVTILPTLNPTNIPVTILPTLNPTNIPVTVLPTLNPTNVPVTMPPTNAPTNIPTIVISTLNPTDNPISNTVNTLNTLKTTNTVNPTSGSTNINEETVIATDADGEVITEVYTTPIVNNDKEIDAETKSILGDTMLFIIIGMIVILCCCIFLAFYIKKRKKQRLKQQDMLNETSKSNWVGNNVQIESIPMQKTQNQNDNISDGFNMNSTNMSANNLLNGIENNHNVIEKTAGGPNMELELDDNNDDDVVRDVNQTEGGQYITRNVHTDNDGITPSINVNDNVDVVATNGAFGVNSYSQMGFVNDSMNDNVTNGNNVIPNDEFIIQDDQYTTNK